MITKRTGNGQTECVGCKEKENKMALTWDSWLYNFNDKPYCQECLFEMLEDYQQRIDKATQYLEYYLIGNYAIAKDCQKSLAYLLSILQDKEVK